MKVIYRKRGEKRESRNGHIKLYHTGTAIGLNFHVWQTRTSGNKIKKLNDEVTKWLIKHDFIIREQKKGPKVKQNVKTN